MLLQLCLATGAQKCTQPVRFNTDKYKQAQDVAATHGIAKCLQQSGTTCMQKKRRPRAALHAAPLLFAEWHGFQLTLPHKAPQKALLTARCCGSKKAMSTAACHPEHACWNWRLMVIQSKEKTCTPCQDFAKQALLMPTNAAFHSYQSKTNC